MDNFLFKDLLMVGTQGMLYSSKLRICSRISESASSRWTRPSARRRRSRSRPFGKSTRPRSKYASVNFSSCRCSSNSYECPYLTYSCLVFLSGTPECRPSPRSLFTRLSREEEDFLNILSQRPSRFILRSILHSCPPLKTNRRTFYPTEPFCNDRRYG